MSVETIQMNTQKCLTAPLAYKTITSRKVYLQAEYPPQGIHAKQTVFCQEGPEHFRPLYSRVSELYRAVASRLLSIGTACFSQGPCPTLGCPSWVHVDIDSEAHTYTVHVCLGRLCTSWIYHLEIF